MKRKTIGSLKTYKQIDAARANRAAWERVAWVGFWAVVAYFGAHLVWAAVR